MCELQGENQKANVEKVNASPGGEFPLRAEAEIILSTVKATNAYKDSVGYYSCLLLKRPHFIAEHPLAIKDQ